MNDERTPIVGTAQFVERNIDPAEATEPLLMLEKMARGSAEDSGAGDALLGKLDTVAVLNVAGWEARNPAQVVADKIGAPATKFYTSEMGGQIGVTARMAHTVVGGRRAGPFAHVAGGVVETQRVGGIAPHVGGPRGEWRAAGAVGAAGVEGVAPPVGAAATGAGGGFPLGLGGQAMVIAADRAAPGGERARVVHVDADHRHPLGGGHRAR